MLLVIVTALASGYILQITLLRQGFLLRGLEGNSCRRFHGSFVLTHPTVATASQTRYLDVRHSDYRLEHLTLSPNSHQLARTMTLQDIFDTLVLERRVTVQLDKSKAESLRVQLVKKWSKYKIDLDSLGFLEDDLAACSLCRRTLSNSQGYEFLLEPRLKQTINYEVLTTCDNTNVSG